MGGLLRRGMITHHSAIVECNRKYVQCADAHAPNDALTTPTSFSHAHAPTPPHFPLRRSQPRSDDTSCMCRRNCFNRVIQRGSIQRLELFYTGRQRGWGVRTLRGTCTRPVRTHAWAGGPDVGDRGPAHQHCRRGRSSPSTLASSSCPRRPSFAVSGPFFPSDPHGARPCASSSLRRLVALGLDTIRLGSTSMTYMFDLDYYKDEDDTEIEFTIDASLTGNSSRYADDAVLDAEPCIVVKRLVCA